MRTIQSAAIVMIAIQCSFGGFWLQGRVVNHLGAPLAGATVAAPPATTTSDAAGLFTLSSSSSITPLTEHSIGGTSLSLVNGRLSVTGGTMHLALYSVSGRLIRSADLGPARKHSRMNLCDLPAGAWLLRANSGSATRTLRLFAAGEAIAGNAHLDLQNSAIITPLPKTAAVSLAASATGYQNRSMSVPNDTGLDLLVTLYPTGYTVPSAVTVAESTETMNFMQGFAIAQCDSDAYNWAAKSMVKKYKAMDAGAPAFPTKSYRVIHLDNEYVRVDMSPDLGMRIIRVIDKTHGSRRSLFQPWGYMWEFPNGLHMNSGGLKASFPFFEHALGIIDDAGNFDAQAGSYIERDVDGGARVVMNLRFDYNQDQRDVADRGKYGDQTLTEVVTLKPGRADFSVRFIADNPNPTRRNKTIWSCALFPRETQNAWGGQWIFPTHWAMDHEAKPPLFDIATNGVTLSYSGAYFALYIPYPFLGAYYPGADASHLRITDQVLNPGAKIVDMTVWKEVWGSTSLIFERPEGWINPFETRDMEFRYYMARGLGAKATYANEHIAIAAKAGNQFAMVSTTPLRVTVYEYNATTSPKVTNQAISPTTAITGSYTAGLRVVSAEGVELCNVQFPLPLVDNSSLYAGVRQETLKTLVYPTDSVDTHQGLYYELATVTAKGNGLSCLAVMQAALKATTADDPDVLVSMANAAYRIGQFGVCDQLITKVNGRRPTQTKYLKALMALERGTAASFDSTVIEGNYFAALQYVKAGNTAAALVKLDSLLAQRPNAISPLLLRAYLKKDLNDAKAGLRLDPGAVEVWAVLAELKYPGATTTLTGLLNQNQMATVRRDAFLQEIKQGVWKHNRRYEYQTSWFELANWPAFPDSLK